MLLATFLVKFFHSYFFINLAESTTTLHYTIIIKPKGAYNLLLFLIQQFRLKLLCSFLFCLVYVYNINIYCLKAGKMSNPGKGGMEFFKKFSDKGGMFAGFKIKGPKEAKNVAQTETNLSYNEKSGEQQKQYQPLSRDDLAVKQQTKEVEQPVSGEIKTEDLSIKRTKSKPAEVTVPVKKVETLELDVKKVQEVSKQIREAKQVRQEKKIEVVQAKITQSSEKVQIVQEKKSEKSSPTSSISQRKKSQKVAPAKKSEEPVVRKPSMNIKQQKPPKKQEDKPKKSGKDQVLDQINEYNIKLAQSVITQKNTQARICEIRESISELRDKISHWTSQQSLCAQRQEYDEAERLQNHIEQAQNKVDELSIEITFAEDQLLKQESEQINILKSQNANLNKIGRRLKLIELELQNDAATIKRQDIQKIQTLKNKQEIEKKKVQRIERDITYQSQQITEFQRLVKQQLESKLNPLNKEKVKLEGQKADLQSQIRELERKLKQKRAQLSDTNKQLKSVNDNIIQTNDSFKEENTKLKQRKNNLQIIENQYDNLKLELEHLEHTIEDQSKAMNAKVEKKLGQAIQIASLAKNIEQKQVTFDDEVENRKVAFDNFTQNGKLLKQFEEMHRSQKDKIKEIEYKKSNITAEISKLQEKRDTIRKKMPIIEVQQKKFADLKNFKAAGLKKNEIKQLSDELALVKEKIQAALIEQHALGIEEQKMKNSQKENIEQEQSLQRNLAISQYRYACIKVEKINEYREAIIRNSSSNIKDKDKLIKELTEVINKKNEELEYLRETYQLHEEKPNGNEEQEDIVEAEEEGEIEEGSNEHRELADNNNQEEIDNLADSNDEERIEEQAQSGYVPLELACGGQEDDQQAN